MVFLSRLLLGNTKVISRTKSFQFKPGNFVSYATEFEYFRAPLILTLVSCQSLARRNSAGRGWVDSLRLYVKGGTGGTGLPGVDGVGGNGGNIYVRATEKISSLQEVRRNNTSQRYQADPGDSSS